MGVTKSTYFITTEPLEERYFFEWKKQQTIISNWKCEPQDKELFENDTTYSHLLKTFLKAKKDLNNYKFDKRNG